MADDDLITEELKRVYRLYGEATRQFRRGLYALIVAGLTIFAFIVVPFLTFRDQVARLEQRQEVLAGELQHARDLVADTHSDLEEAEEISNDFSRFVQRYRSFETFREMEEQAKEHAQQLQELRRSYADWQDEAMAAWVQGETKRPPEEIIRSNRRLASLDRPCYWQSGAAYAACQLCETFKDRHRDVVARLSGLDAVDDAAGDPG